MSAFRVGQRVRVVGGVFCIGCEATITAIPNPHYDIGDNRDCRLAIDGHPCERSKAADGSWSANFCNLAPLTDPRASEFIADMERYALIAKKVNA